MFNLMASPSSATGRVDPPPKKDSLAVLRCPVCTYTVEETDAQLGLELLKIHALSHSQPNTPAPPQQRPKYSRTDNVGVQQEPLESQQTSLLISLVLAGVGWMLVMYGALTRHWTLKPKTIYPQSLDRMDQYKNMDSLTKMFGNVFEHQFGDLEGLFTCNTSSDGCRFYNYFVQALVIIGIIAASAAVLLVGISVVVLRGKLQAVTIVGGVACLAGGMSIVLGAVVYAGVMYTTTYIQYSFTLTAAGGFVLLVAGSLALVKGRVAQPGNVGVTNA